MVKLFIFLCLAIGFAIGMAEFRIRREREFGFWKSCWIVPFFTLLWLPILLLCIVLLLIEKLKDYDRK